jgi:DNA-binding SARP family transcriptional activator
MRFRVLGPLEVQDASGAVVEVGSPKLRALLALLLLEAGRVVPLDRIVDELWGERPPATATGTVQSYVSNLRRMLEPGHGSGRPPEVLVTRAPGYLLDVPAAEVDALVLPSLVDEGGRLLAADAPEQARAVLCRALALERGEPLADLSDGATAVAARSRLQDLAVLAREHLATADTRLGHPDRAVSALEALVAEHPLRERLWARLVEALWAAGRRPTRSRPAARARGCSPTSWASTPAPSCARSSRPSCARSCRQPVRPAVPGVPAPRTGGPTPVPAPEERPLVGRRAERARLRAALGDVTRGSGAVVVLEGEAGIGKTRLAEAATALAAAQGWRVAWSRCADDAGAPALWPWLQLLDQLGSGPLEVPSGNDPDQSRWSLFQDLRSRLQEAAAQAPLLVVLDDVQAADGTSLQLLSLLARHLDGVRLLVLVTVRTVGEALPVAVLECLAALAREPRASRLQLSGLGEGDVRELVESRLAGDGARTGRAAAGLARELHARTDGNPFFVVELVQLLRSEEQLAPTGRSLPPSVRDVLDRRLGHLPEATLELLRLAAVAGARGRPGAADGRRSARRRAGDHAARAGGRERHRVRGRDRLAVAVQPRARAGDAGRRPVAAGGRAPARPAGPGARGPRQPGRRAPGAPLLRGRARPRHRAGLPLRHGRGGRRPVRGSRTRRPPPTPAARCRCCRPPRRRPRSATTCSSRSATTCCAAGTCSRRRRSSARRSSWRARPATPAASRRRPASGAASRCGTGGRTASSTPRSSRCCRTSPTARATSTRRCRPGCSARSGSSWPTATTAPPAWSTPTGGRAGPHPRRPGAARAHPQQRQPRGLGVRPTGWSAGWPRPTRRSPGGPGLPRARSSSRGCTAAAAPAPGRRRGLHRRPGGRRPASRRR